MRRRVESLLFLAAMLILAITKSYGQDIHFSQFNAAPLQLNPALTGVNGCDYRFVANYRSQWAGVGKFNTVAASYDMAVLRKTKKSNYGGIGISLFSDRAGDLALSTTQVNVHMSYTVLLNSKGSQLLTAGLVGGIGHRSIDFSKLTTDSQFGDQGFNPNLPTGEQLNNNNRIYADVGAGFLWSYTVNKNTNFYSGFSVTHINQPNLSFLDDRNEKLYMKVTIHGGAHFKLSNQLFLLPSFMYLNQGPHNELTFGSLLKIRKSLVPSDKTSFFIGGWYRLKDAVIISGRVDVASFSIGLSYDLNISKLTPATKLNGGPEVSLVYTGCFRKKNNTTYCPML